MKFIIILVLGVVASVGFAAYAIAKDEKEEKLGK